MSFSLLQTWSLMLLLSACSTQVRSVETIRSLCSTSESTLSDAEQDAEEKAIREVLNDQVLAWNKSDIDGFMVGYWKNEKLTFISGGDITRGWIPTRERYIKKYQADGKDKMGKLSFDELEIEMLGNTAAKVTGRFDLVRGAQKDWGRFTLVFRKLPEGWRIIHDHTSIPPVEKK